MEDLGGLREGGVGAVELGFSDSRAYERDSRKPGYS